MKDKIKIGVIGYSGKSFPIFDASQKFINALAEVLERHKYYNTMKNGKRVNVLTKDECESVNYVKYPKIEIVSGYTDYGIPALSYVLAKLYCQKSYCDIECTTTGFAPKEALSDKRCKVNKEIIVGENYGDESEAFIDYIDVLIKIGGGSQSIKEFDLFKKKKPNNIAIKKKLICY